MRSRLVVSFCLLALVVSLPLPAQVIQGCVDNNKGDVRILKAGQTCDSAKEYAISWNAAGIPGAPGTNGRDGRDGTNGLPGRDGRDGLNCEPAAAAALKQIGTVTFTDVSGVPGDPIVTHAIPIFEVSGGVENSTTIGSATGGAGAGKVKFNPIKVTKKLDVASATLFHRLSSGTHFATVVIDLSTATAIKKYTLETVFLTNYDLVQPTGSSAEYESITLVFGKLTVDVDGVTKCWNQVTNISC